MISRVPGRRYQLRGVIRRNLGPAHFKDFGAVNVRTLKVKCISFRSLCKKRTCFIRGMSSLSPSFSRKWSNGIQDTEIHEKIYRQKN